MLLGDDRRRCCWQLDWGALERLEAKPEFKPSSKAADCFPTQQLQARAPPLRRAVVAEQARGVTDGASARAVQKNAALIAGLHDAYLPPADGSFATWQYPRPQEPEPEPADRRPLHASRGAGARAGGSITGMA